MPGARRCWRSSSSASWTWTADARTARSPATRVRSHAASAWRPKATRWSRSSVGARRRCAPSSVSTRPSRPASAHVAWRGGSRIASSTRSPTAWAARSRMRRAAGTTPCRAGRSRSRSSPIAGSGWSSAAPTCFSVERPMSRGSRPFLAVNCGALRPDLAFSQLFGHRKGAFTGAHAEGVGLVEAAHGGTLFLDEVGELPHDVQVTLLRFLESGEYLRLGETQVRRGDVRVIAATNRELRGDAGERNFRRDLLFRLNEIELRLPSLRERREDILPLARHFLAFYGGLEGPRLGADADGVLLAYAWPGNVRELENVMKRVAALLAGGTVYAAELVPFLSHQAPAAATAASAPDERAATLSAYERADGNKSRLAELLGVSRKTLYARLKRLRIELH